MRTIVTELEETYLIHYERIHHLPPPGYLLDLQAKKFVRDPERFGLLAEAFQQVADGKAISAVLHRLNDVHGFRMPRHGTLGGGSLGRTHFYRLLSDPFYAGHVRAGDRLARGFHEAMVTEDLFLKIQQLLSMRRRNRSTTISHIDESLAGANSLAETANKQPS